MRRVLGWGVFVAFLASLTWLLGRVLPVPPRCIIGEDFHRFHWGGLSADGSRLITRSLAPQNFEGNDVWDTHTGKWLGTLRFGGQAASPDGRFSAGQGRNGPCIISDLQQVREYPAGFGNLPSSSLFFSPLGEYLLVLEERVKEGKSPRAFVVDPPTGKVLKTLPTNEDPGQKVLGFTPQDNLIIWQAKNKRCEIRRLPSLELAYRKSVVEPFLFSPGNQFLVARDVAEKAPAPWLVWDLSLGTSCNLLDDQGLPFQEGLSEGKQPLRWRNGKHFVEVPPKTHFFSSDNRYVALVAKKENEVRIWETKSGKLLLQVQFFGEGFFHRGAFSKDGQRLVLETTRYHLVAFNMETGKKLWQASQNSPYFSAFLPYSHSLQIGVLDELETSLATRRTCLEGDTGVLFTPPLEKGFVSGEYRLVYEPAVNRWLAQPPTTRVQIFHLLTNERVYDFNVPEFEKIRLSKDGRALLTKHTKKGDRYYVWSLPPERSAAQFAIPLGLGVGALVLLWAWRLRGRARQKAASVSLSRLKTESTANSPSVT